MILVPGVGHGHMSQQGAFGFEPQRHACSATIHSLIYR